MANEEHLAILKQGVEVWNKWRERLGSKWPDLRDTSLESANLQGMDLHGVDLGGANLHRANLRKTNLTLAHLEGANLRGADFGGADLTEAGLREADLMVAILREAKLDTAELISADLRGANLTEANLRAADFERANLEGADLTGATLNWVNLDGANFVDVTIGYTYFADNDLSNVEGLDEVRHDGPSFIDVSTLYRSGGKIPETFLRGCGVPDSLIEYLPSLLGAMEPVQFYSCFISYSTKDDDFARRLHSRMRDNHLRVWFADEDMKGGAKIHEQIDQAIRVHDKLVLVLSEQSIQSEWVMTEIRKARKAELRDKRRKLFPIRLIDMDTLRDWECFDADTGKDLAVEVREYFIPDFSHWKDHDSFERAFARFLKDLQATEAPPVPEPRPKLISKDEVTAMLNPDDIKHQQTLLTTYRRNLAHLVNQAAQYGGEVFAPPIVVNSIGEARDNIRRIKKVLRDTGVSVANEANDEPPQSERSPVAPIGGPHITIQSGDYVAGDKPTGIDQRGQKIQGNQTNSAGPIKEERMSVFDQRGQHVNYQYNAAGDINFGAVQNRVDLVGELEKLKAELNKAGAAQVIDAEVVTDAEYQITKAVQEAKKPEPKKETILERIDGAKKLIEGIAAAGGMVTALVKAAELVQKFF